MKRLRNVASDVKRFDEVTAALGKKRGVLVFQTPPNLKADLALLDDFLAVLPKTRCALEFRHSSWFTDEVRGRLAHAGRPLVFNDADVDGCPRWTTAAGSVWKLRRVRYSTKELTALAAAVKADKSKELLIYFKHEETASGPKLAEELRKRISG